MATTFIARMRGFRAIYAKKAFEIPSKWASLDRVDTFSLVVKAELREQQFKFNAFGALSQKSKIKD